MGRLVVATCLFAAIAFQSCNQQQSKYKLEGNWMYLESDTSFVEVCITSNTFLYFHEMNGFSNPQKYIIEDGNKIMFPKKRLRRSEWYQGKFYFINDSMLVFDNIVNNMILHKIVDDSLTINDKGFKLDSYNNILLNRKAHLLVNKDVINEEDIGDYIEHNSCNLEEELILINY